MLLKYSLLFKHLQIEVIGNLYLDYLKNKNREKADLILKLINLLFTILLLILKCNIDPAAIGSNAAKRPIRV